MKFDDGRIHDEFAKMELDIARLVEKNAGLKS